jgi:hypothetical protein
MSLKLFLVIIILFEIGRYRSELPKSVPVVLDTFGITKQVYPDHWMDFAGYDPLYIGTKKDTLYVFYKGNGLYSPTIEDFDKREYSYDERIREYKISSPGQVALTVDTTRYISAYPVLMDSTVDGVTYEVPMSYKAFPVIMENKSRDTIKIGHRYTLLLLLEARDKNGKWKPIESYNWYWGPDSVGVFLPPSQIAVTSVNLTAGKFKTKLRLRYNNNFSNEYTGYISLTQFEDEYDENGKRKSLPKE